jgi:hypothetical protein
MGGNKGQDIEQIPLLKWYRDEFRERASKANARIMVIGYGFADLHINEIIVNACQAGVELFLVDPIGLDVLDRAAHECVGVSRRSLTTTLHNDSVERGKLMSFFIEQYAL